MAAFMACLFVMLAVTRHSNAAYCLCKNGINDQVLQKNIDYACGAGADCTPILQNGACFSPNTVKSHCDWAVNSYYQRKSQAGGSCDFQGTASLSSNAPGQSSTCPNSPSNPGTISTPPSSTQTPTMGTGTGTGTGMGTTPTSTIPGTGTGTGSTNGFGLAPTGTGLGNEASDSVTVHETSSTLLISICLSLFSSGLICLVGAF